MIASHRDCGTTLVWKPLIDDHGELALLPWCRTCVSVITDEGIEGDPQQIPVLAEDVAAARLLGTAWRTISVVQ